MNISPINLFKSNLNFKCSQCKQEQKQTEDKTEQPTQAKEEGTWSNWGGGYVYFVPASQVKIYEENEAKYKEKLANSKPLAELQGETLEEYFERKKLEWSM